MKSGRWTSDEVFQLMMLRLAGRSWDDIGLEFNRKPTACAWRHNYELLKRGAERERAFTSLAERSRAFEAERSAKLAALASLNTVKPSSPPTSTPPSPSVTRSGRAFVGLAMRDGVDIRDIRERGATAVLLGDPVPGRSALDERWRS